MNPFSWLLSHKPSRPLPDRYRPRIEPLEIRVMPTHHFLGFHSSNDLGPFWSDPLNWQEGTLPAAGEDVAIHGQSCNLDINATIGNLLLDGTGFTFACDLNGPGSTTLTLNGDMNLIDTNPQEFPETLFEPAVNVQFTGSNTIHFPVSNHLPIIFLGSDLSGTGFTVVGPGRLDLASFPGVRNTTLTGTVTVQGTVQLLARNPNAFGTAILDMQGGILLPVGGSVTLDAGITFDGNCRLNSDQPDRSLGFVGPVSIARDSMVTCLGPTLTFTGPFQGSSGTLTLAGVAVTTFSGNVSGDFNVVSGVQGGFGGGISGNHSVTVNTGQLAWGVAGSVVSDTDSFTVAAGASLVLGGTNTFTGTADIAGSLVSANQDALGACAVTLHDGSALATLDPTPQTASNAFTFSGTASLQGDWMLTGAQGALLLNGSTTLRVPGLVTVTGSLSGTGPLIKDGDGTLVLAGVNTYGGGTQVAAGILTAQKGRALGAANTNTTIAAGAALRLQGGIAIANESLTLAGNGPSGIGALESFTGSNGWVGPITLAGDTTVTVDAGTLTLKRAITGNAGLDKEGAGTLRLLADCSFTGPTIVGKGHLIADASIAASASAAVSGGASLAGRGTVGAISVAAQGVLHPGDPNTPGTLGTQKGVTLNAGAKFVVLLKGATAGLQQYAQLVSAGPIALGTRAVLQVQLGFSPQVGQSFTILSNQSGQMVQGHFLNKPEGATFKVNGFTFQITYQAGGLDVVLTCIATPTPTPALLPSAPAPTGATPAVSGRISVSVPVRAPVRLQTPAPRLVTDTVVPHIPARRAPHGEFDAEP